MPGGSLFAHSILTMCGKWMENLMRLCFFSYFCGMKGNELTPRIGLFGRRNVGKSTTINYLTGQQVAIVSDTPGTTTDPVRKRMEISGIGPVVLIDTAGIDDQRVERSLAVLPECDVVMLLHWAEVDGEPEAEVRRLCDKHGIPIVEVDTSRMPGREALIEAIRHAMPESALRTPSLLGDVVREGDVVVMVCPIDSSAPEGRMILPQVQVLRDLMDIHAVAVCCQPQELAGILGRHHTDDGKKTLMEPPRLVVTDSQVFHTVAETVPDDVYLTSFSVVLARQKGLFADYVKGTPAIGSLRDGDRVLLLESCTHNVTCEDIGRVKLPRLMSAFTGRKLEFDVVGGQSPVERPMCDYSLVVQCGGCVVNRRQLRARLQPAIEAGVPVSNYGLAIAYMTGIFERSMRIFNPTISHV